jgi:predicted DNA-binding transcriptional regulator YafY
MRASRLLSMLLILQGRGQVTGAQLAAELGVSVRTIYRDAEALQAAGIPLRSAAGPAGGYRLPDEYRTRLTGLSGPEAMGLFLTGLPGPAADLGLGGAVAAARVKLAAALPASLVDQAVKVQERFHLDTSGWYASPDSVPYLAAVAHAVWEQRRIRVTYSRWEQPDTVRRTLDPYGLVVKGGRWYLVACHQGDVHTYRVSQIVGLSPSDERFVRPAHFDLARYWARYLADFDQRLYQGQATIRLSPAGRKQLAATMSAAVVDAVERSAIPAADGRIQAVIPIESPERAESDLLRLGAEVEVVEPLPLRKRMATTAIRLTQLYQT